MDFRSFGQQFNLVLDWYIQDKVDQTIDRYGDGLIPSLEYLYEYNEWGKAIRPYMVYLRYKLCGGQDDVYQMMQVGLINELIHLFALIHDDIIDQWLIRRHRPTYHMHLRHLYDDQHVGDSQSILVGDLLYSRAVSWALAIPSHDARMIISDMIEKVIIGELLDVHYSYREGIVSAQEIAAKDDLKSGQYTFTAPMMLGATLAGADEQTIATVREIGTIVGVAFQMRDDLLDRLPDDDGKTKFSDIHEGNQTVVWVYLLDHVTQEEKEQLITLRRKDLTDNDREWLRSLVAEYHLQHEIGHRINTDLDQARILIQQGSRDTQYVEYVMEIVDFLSINKN